MIFKEENSHQNYKTVWRYVTIFRVECYKFKFKSATIFGQLNKLLFTKKNCVTRTFENIHFYRRAQ